VIFVIGGAASGVLEGLASILRLQCSNLRGLGKYKRQEDVLVVVARTLEALRAPMSSNAENVDEL